METLNKIKDFCQYQENEFSVLGYDASKYELGYISAIREIQEICEEISDNTTVIEKLEAEKKELLEALEKVKKWGGEFGMDYQIYEEIESLIQKHKATPKI